MEDFKLPTSDAVIPASVRYAPIPNGAKLLYGEIRALTPAYGYCFASNKRFMRLYGKTEKTIQNWINQLVEMGFVSCVIKGNKRELRDIVTSGKIGSFEPPTVQDVRTYCRAQKLDVDAELFIYFYASKGWRVGKNLMQDWKAAVQTWAKRLREVNEKQAQEQCKSQAPRALIGGRDMERRPYTEEEFQALITRLDEDDDL